MVLGIPSSKGFFSTLQESLMFANKGGMHLPNYHHDQSTPRLQAPSLGPINAANIISELIPDNPVTVGPHDALGLGTGGVWLPAITNTPVGPILWQA